MKAPGPTERGSLLIVTLWVVIILGALAVAIGRQLSVELRITRYRLAREQVRAMARSGIYFAMQTVQEDTIGVDAPREAWAAPQAVSLSPGHHLLVVVSDEERKLSLNDASLEQLDRLTGSAEIAQTVVDYRDAADPTEDRATDAPPYYAKNGPIGVPEELGDLPGMTLEFYELLREYTTPYVATGTRVNLNTATPEVLRALGLTETAIGAITQYRNGSDGPDAHEQDGVFEQAGLPILQTLKDHAGVDLTGTPDGNVLISNAIGVGSGTFTVVSEASTERPAVRARVEAVIRRGEGGAAFPRIVAWREG